MEMSINRAKCLFSFPNAGNFQSNGNTMHDTNSAISRNSAGNWNKIISSCCSGSGFFEFSLTVKINVNNIWWIGDLHLTFHFFFPLFDEMLMPKKLNASIPRSPATQSLTSVTVTEAPEFEIQIFPFVISIRHSFFKY